MNHIVRNIFSKKIMTRSFFLLRVRCCALSNKKGYTLLELIVSISIIAIIAGIFFANYRETSNDNSTKVAARIIASEIRKVQNYALGLKEFKTFGVPAGGWGVRFESGVVGTNKMVIFADRDESRKYREGGPIDEKYREVELPRNIVVDSFNLNTNMAANFTYIVFQPPNPDTFIGGAQDESDDSLVDGDMEAWLEISLKYKDDPSTVVALNINRFGLVNIGNTLIADPQNDTAPCFLPWGDILYHGQSLEVYEDPTVDCGNACVFEQRACTDGVLDGTYQEEVCVEIGCTPCPPLIGTTTPVSHGDTITAYENSTEACHVACVFEDRLCFNGSYTTGSYPNASCNEVCSDCLPLPGWSDSVAHNDSIEAFLYAGVLCGSPMPSETRTCDDGSFDGTPTYVHETCDNGCATCPSPWGGDPIDHGDVVTAYLNSTEACEGTCDYIERTCNNGTLGGAAAYQEPTCVVDFCDPCSVPASLGGGTIEHNDSVPANENASVPCGDTCASQERLCFDGTLQGTYDQMNCTVVGCLDCPPFDGAGGDVPHGSTFTAYELTSVACGQNCVSEEAVCNDSNWDSTMGYTETSCSAEECIYPAGFAETDLTNCLEKGFIPDLYKARGRCIIDSEINGPWYTFLSSNTEDATRAAFDADFTGICAGLSAIDDDDCNDLVLCTDPGYVYASNTPFCINPSFTPFSCTDEVCDPCMLPWSGAIPHFTATTSYETPSVLCDDSCFPEQRLCNDGNLEGSYVEETCSMVACLNCPPLPNGVTAVDHGDTITAYENSTVGCYGTCSQEDRTCSDGGYTSGSYTYESCSNVCADCSVPWTGPDVSHGTPVTAYQNSSVGCDESCVSDSDTCDDGTLVLLYPEETCTPDVCQDCPSPWGGDDILHNNSVPAYLTATECGSCTIQTRNCDDSSLDGAGDFETCTPVSCPYPAQVTDSPNPAYVSPGLLDCAHSDVLYYVPDLFKDHANRCISSSEIGSYWYTREDNLPNQAALIAEFNTDYPAFCLAEYGTSDVDLCNDQMLCSASDDYDALTENCDP
jgi:prepilin-type N-terminal cleavage/methylation domain-containing protein